MKLGSDTMKEYQKKAEQMAEEMSKNYEEAAEEMQKSMNAYHLEMANGEEMSDVDKSDLRKAFKDLDEENNYISLRKGTTFVQAAVTDDGFLMEYRDNKGYFRSDNANISEKEVKDVMYGFLEGKKDWKDEIDWKKAE
jgi:hypothetical protein